MVELYSKCSNEEEMPQERRNKAFFSYLHESSNEDEIKERQYRFIKYASHGVNSFSVWNPAPLHVDPQDIPKKTRANALWYKRMSQISLSRPITHLKNNEEVQKNFVAFLSHDPSRINRFQDYYQIMRYMDQENLRLHRKSNLDHFMNRYEKWSEIAKREALVQTTFPEPWIKKIHGLDYIDNAWKLFQFGLEMSNCVSGRETSILRGLCQIYRLDLNGVIYCVEIIDDYDKLKIGEVKKRFNVAPTKPGWKKIQKTLELEVMGRKVFDEVPF